MSDRRMAPIYDPVLKASPLFEDLSELELNAVATFLEPRRARKEEVIFTEGVIGEEMFVLVSGRISASVNNAEGSRHQIFEIKPGDFFGEMSIIANESRSASLTAVVDSELLVLHGIDFYRIIFEHPMIGVKILKAIRKIQNIWLDQVSKHLSDLMRWGETARRRAVCDELTGLYNRRFLEKSAQDRFEAGVVGLRSVSLLMMDLDKIHTINERHNSKGGDLVFIATADVLRSTTRPGDICARLSGDEFAILLPDTDFDEARTIAEEIRHNLSVQKIIVPQNPDGTGQTEIVVSISIGVASAPLHADTWEDLNLAADSALHHSKLLGRNRVEAAER
ncbi:MAG: GGDEF domain-containing protein [Treponema sp.]|nr:GGDEF domain-containing protein [Treponema sp.]